MLEGSVTYLIVMFWGIWLLRGRRIEQRSVAVTTGSLLFALYLSQLVAATLFPLPIEMSVIDRGRAMAAAGFGPGNNVVLFNTVRDFAESEAGFINQIVGNFLLLVPLGLMVPLLWQTFRSWQRAVLLVVFATLAIEFSQLGISTLLGYTYRSFDVDDLWLNALGGTLAAVVASFVARRVTSESAEGTGDNGRDVTGSRENVPCRSALG